MPPTRPLHKAFRVTECTVCLRLSPLEPQSRSGDNPLKFQVVCPQNGTAVVINSYSQRSTLALPSVMCHTTLLVIFPPSIMNVAMSRACFCVCINCVSHAQSFPGIMSEFRRVDCPAGGLSSLPRHRGPQRSPSNTASAQRERVQGPGLPRFPRRECAAVSWYTQTDKSLSAVISGYCAVYA